MEARDVVPERQALDRAVVAYQERRRALRGPDGDRLHPDERERQLVAARETLDAVFRTVERVAARASVDASTRAERLAQRDPMDVLLQHELTQAATRAPFVAEDAQRLDPATLAARAQAAIATNDRASMALHLRYGRQRLTATPETERVGGGMQALRETLDDLSERLLSQGERGRIDALTASSDALVTRAAVVHYFLRTYGAVVLPATPGDT